MLNFQGRVILDATSLTLLAFKNELGFFYTMIYYVWEICFITSNSDQLPGSW